MRALALQSFDESAGLAELPVPEIRPDEFLVRVVAASINAFDWKVAAGMLTNNFKFRFPVTIGRDFSGIVEAAGSEARGLAAGDEVFGYLSSPELHYGSLAEFVPSGNACMVSKPAAIGFNEAAALPLAGMTAQRCIEPLDLAPGMTLLLIGAAGGVGSFAIQLAAHRGATVIATGLADDEEYLRRLGAAEFVDRGADLKGEIRSRYPDGVDALIDVVDRGAEFLEMAGLVAQGGCAVSTHRQADPEKLEALRIRGANVGGTPDPALLEELGEFAAAGTLTVPLAGSYPLERAAEGLAHVRDEHVRGKYVITVARAG